MIKKYALELSCLAGCVVTLLCFWPGICTPDSWGQFSQSVTGRYTAHHPPAMAMLWSVFHTLTQTPTTWSMLVFQLGMTWGGIYLICRYIIQRDLKLRLLLPVSVESDPSERSASAEVFKCQCIRKEYAGWPLLPILFFTPPLFIYAGVLWKDIQSTAALLFSFGLMATASRINCRLSKSFVLLLAFCVLIYGYLARPFSLPGIIPLLVYLAFAACGKHSSSTCEDASKSILPNRERNGICRLKVILPALFLFGVMVPLYPISNLVCADKGTPITFSMLFDIIGVSIRTGTDYCPDFVKELPGHDFANYRKNFNYDYPHLIARDTPGLLEASKTEMKEVFRTWLLVAGKAPVAFLKQRIQSFCAVLKFGTNRTFCRHIFFYGINTPFHGGVDENVPIPESRPIKTMERVRWIYLRIFSLSIFFKPYLVLLLSLWGCFAVFFHRGLSETNYLCGTLFLSSLLYILPNAVIYGSHDFRYAFWSYCASGIALILLTLDALNAEKRTLPGRVWLTLPCLLALFYFIDTVLSP